MIVNNYYTNISDQILPAMTTATYGRNVAVLTISNGPALVSESVHVGTVKGFLSSRSVRSLVPD